VAFNYRPATLTGRPGALTGCLGALTGRPGALTGCLGALAGRPGALNDRARTARNRTHSLQSRFDAVYPASAGAVVAALSNHDRITTAETWLLKAATMAPGLESRFGPPIALPRTCVGGGGSLRPPEGVLRMVACFDLCRTAGPKTPSDLADSATSPGGPGEEKMGTPSGEAGSP
jgi:hypothetical protein